MKDWDKPCLSLRNRTMWAQHMRNAVKRHSRKLTFEELVTKCKHFGFAYPVRSALSYHVLKSVNYTDDSHPPHFIDETLVV